MKDTPKVCFLVMAHHQPAVFERLIRNITWQESDVVVHIDVRADITKFHVSGARKVQFVPKRRKVNWAGWSLNQTLIELLEYSLRNSDADYFVYLAGTDFPIRPKDELLAFLKQHKPKNFLNHYPLVTGIWGYGLIDKFRLSDQKARFIDLRSQRDRKTFNKFPLWRRYGFKSIKAVEGFLDKKFRPRNTSFMQLYHGSSRWCLNRDTAKYVVEYYKSRKSGKLRNFLRLCVNSDELFIQTAVLNSDFRYQCIEFDENESKNIFDGKVPPLQDEKRVYLHYIDWNPAREDPAILVESDIDALRKSEKFFACKFTDDRSIPVINIIEKKILLS